MINRLHQAVVRQVLLLAGPYTGSPEFASDWLSRLAAQGFQEAIVCGGGSFLAMAPEGLILRALPSERAGDLLEAMRLGRRFLAGRFAALDIAHPFVGHLSDMAIFHRERGSLLTMAIAESPAGRPYALIDDRERLVWYHPAPPEGQIHSRWHDAGVYMIETDLLRFVRQAGVATFPDLIGHLLSDALPVYGYQIEWK